MSLSKDFTDLSGEWKGTKRLYLAGESGPEKSSGSRLTIAKAARGTFLLLDYTWKFDGDPQEGVLLLGYDAAKNAATAAWGDSWHMSQNIMHCVGTIDDHVFNVRGGYAAPPGADWGWRIALTILAEHSINIVMHNISPEGKEDLAVRAEFARVG